MAYSAAFRPDGLRILPQASVIFPKQLRNQNTGVSFGGGYIQVSYVPQTLPNPKEIVYSDRELSKYFSYVLDTARADYREPNKKPASLSQTRTSGSGAIDVLVLQLQQPRPEKDKGGEQSAKKEDTYEDYDLFKNPLDSQPNSRIYAKAPKPNRIYNAANPTIGTSDSKFYSSAAGLFKQLRLGDQEAEDNDDGKVVPITNSLGKKKPLEELLSNPEELAA